MADANQKKRSHSEDHQAIWILDSVGLLDLIFLEYEVSIEV